MQIETQDLCLAISPEDGVLHLHSRTFTEASFHFRINASCSIKEKDFELLNQSWSILETKEPAIIETKIGPIRQVSYHVETTLSAVEFVLRLGLSLGEPLAFIQIELINGSPETLVLDRIAPLIVQPGDLHLGTRGAQQDPCFYSNGWQSWSSTGTYGLGEKQHTSILGRFQNPMVINPGTPQPKDKSHFAGDMFGILGDRTSRIGVLAGFLSQKSHFGSLEARMAPEPSLTVWANGDRTQVPPGAQITTDWLVLSFVDLDAQDPLGAYLDAVAREHEIQSPDLVPVGWCSWYHFYENITQEVIESNLDSVVALKPEIPLPLLQIDDGFETFPGDWYDFDPGFPNGLKPLVQKAKDSGLTPGLWLAPYIVHPKARLVKEHPDWLLRDSRGKPVTAGFVWNSFTYALDLTNPDALAYTCDVIRTAVEDWGFEYLKLDFLYAAALDGVYQNPTQTRAQVLRRGFEALRKAAGPDVTMLACGCPLGSALGLCEAMRISADVSGYWKPHFPSVSLLLQKEPHMPSARNAIHNILTRAPLHRHWWINDPDCLLVRPDTDLTLAEVQSLATVIGLTGGSLLLSDDLPALPEDRLRLVQILLPVIDRRARVMDLFDENTPSRLQVDLDGPAGDWNLLALFNWEDKPTSLTFSPQNMQLPDDQIWWLREFWTGTIGQMGSDSSFTSHDVPPHGVRVVAARRFDANQPAYLGSDLHLSQGLEISQWQADERELSLRFDLRRRASGRLHFYLPWQPAGAWFKGKTRTLQDQGLGIVSIDLENLDREALKIIG